MSDRGGRSGGFRGGAAALACPGRAGTAESPALPVAPGRAVDAPVEPELLMRPLSVAPDVDPSPDTGMARADGVRVDARLLVITADGTNAAFNAITSALKYLGTPYDVF